MDETLIALGTIGLLAGIVAALIALEIQRRWLAKPQAQQEKRLAELEAQLVALMRRIQKAWQRLETEDAARVEELVHQYEAAGTWLTLERELARLPLVEDVPVALDANGHRYHAPANWRLPTFHKANLSGRDLSHRYIGRADLRDAQLTDTNFFMADLSGACLAGANLSGADLSGANLSDADLRGATLTGANLLVADLHKAILVGTHLLGARNLTAEQIQTTIYDNTTQLDVEINITIQPAAEVATTLPRIPQVKPTVLPSTPAPAPTETEVPAPSLPIETSDPSDQSDSDTPPEAEASTLTIPSETSGIASVAVLAPIPETPQPTSPSDTTFVTEPLASSLLPSDDSPPDPKVTDPLVDIQESKYTEEADTAIPKRKYNGKKRVKAN